MGLLGGICKLGEMKEQSLPNLWDPKDWQRKWHSQGGACVPCLPSQRGIPHINQALEIFATGHCDLQASTKHLDYFIGEWKTPGHWQASPRYRLLKTETLFWRCTYCAAAPWCPPCPVGTWGFCSQILAWQTFVSPRQTIHTILYDKPVICCIPWGVEAAYWVWSDSVYLTATGTLMKSSTTEPRQEVLSKIKCVLTHLINFEAFL